MPTRWMRFTPLFFFPAAGAFSESSAAPPRGGGIVRPWRPCGTTAARPQRARSDRGADRLYLGVEIERLMAHLPAPAGLLVAPEGKSGIKDVVAVDPDGAGPEAAGEAMCLGQVACPNAGGQTIGGL